MKERAALLGGALTIQNRRDKSGVAVAVRLPLPSEDEIEFVPEIAAQ